MFARRKYQQNKHRSITTLRQIAIMLGRWGKKENNQGNGANILLLLPLCNFQRKIQTQTKQDITRGRERKGHGEGENERKQNGIEQNKTKFYIIFGVGDCVCVHPISDVHLIHLQYMSSCRDIRQSCAAATGQTKAVFIIPCIVQCNPMFG